MNYGKKGTKDKIHSINSKKSKYAAKLLLNLFKVVLIAFLFLVVVGAFAGFGMVQGIIDNAPEVTPADLAPEGFATTVYNDGGDKIATLVASGANRTSVTYDQIPEDLINAIIAIEDERFWTHNGIDFRGITRAAVRAFTTKDLSEGASTITQQLIKNNVFEGGAETTAGAKMERKLQEQYLAVQLEKSMSKETIIEYYLNTVNFGSNTLGVQAASMRYFNKNVWELTLAECTTIAGITQNPFYLNPITYPERNAERRLLVLNNMLRLGYITDEQKDEILADDVYERIQVVNAAYQEESSAYSYFVDSLIEQVIEDLKKKKGYTENQAYNLVYKGGLDIHTTQNATMQQVVDEEIANPENYALFNYSISYRLSVTHEDGTEEHFSEQDIKNYEINTKGNTSFNALYGSEEEIQAKVDEFRTYIMEETDTILGENLTVTIQPQVSFVLMNQKTGYVKAISGGRGEKTASLTLNRAVGTVRQPGSTFKTIASFAPALDTAGATLATVYYDAPYTVFNKSIRNWWGSRGYVGYANIRQGIVFSMNIIASKTLMETTTIPLGVEYSKSFGITSLTDSDYTASLALGGLTYGTSNLELTAAYATIANGGVYTQPIFYTKILDNTGKILLTNEPETRRVIKESTAFLLTDALAGSMVGNRLPTRAGVTISSTSTSANIANMSNAGKSGTTTGNNDLWFVGFTPYYTAGIWTGYDENQSITESSSYHKQMWRKIMSRVHEGLSDPGFAIPDSIETHAVCMKSGKLAIEGVCDHDPRGSMIYTEYFAKGTAPTEVCDTHIKVTICTESGMLAGDNCPDGLKESRIYMIVPEIEENIDDLMFAMPAGMSNSICTIHNHGPGSGESSGDVGISTNTPPVTSRPGPTQPTTTRPSTTAPTTRPSTTAPSTTAPTTSAPITTAPTTTTPPATIPPTTTPTTEAPTTASPPVTTAEE